MFNLDKVCECSQFSAIRLVEEFGALDSRVSKEQREGKKVVSQARTLITIGSRSAACARVKKAAIPAMHLCKRLLVIVFSCKTN